MVLISINDPCGRFNDEDVIVDDRSGHVPGFLVGSTHSAFSPLSQFSHDELSGNPIFHGLVFLWVSFFGGWALQSLSFMG